MMKEQAAQQLTQAHDINSSANVRQVSSNKTVKKQPLTAIVLFITSNFLISTHIASFLFYFALLKHYSDYQGEYHALVNQIFNNI
jgi:hypothetical protein